MAEGDVIAAEGLQRQIGIDDVIFRVGVEKLGGLIVEHLAQQRADRLALDEPLPAQFCHGLGGFGFVEGNEPRHPAKREILMAERIQNPAASDWGNRGW
jgi:hypothetical protein